MDIDFRPITPEELHPFLRTVWTAFGAHPGEDDLGSLWDKEEMDRALAAFDGDAVVGAARAFSFELTLPGLASVPAAGVTAVGVLPTHRRRGILRGLMTRQLADVAERGEPVAVLGASESIIYGRFGYGLSTTGVDYEIDVRHAAWAVALGWGGRVRLVEADQARKVLPELFDCARRACPGEVSRSSGWWAELFRDSEHERRGAGPWFFAVYEEAGGSPLGYAAYRIKEEWDAFPRSTVRIDDWVALRPGAYAALWDYCLHIDLVTSVIARGRPPDEPLFWMLADPRRLRTTRVRDGLWVRLVDIPAALSARRYAAEGSLALEVADSLRPEGSGRYVLEAAPGGAACRRDAAARPDLAMSVADLGATYLGGVRWSTLARAGRVEELTPGALGRADALFACDPLPWCRTRF